MKVHGYAEVFLHSWLQGSHGILIFYIIHKEELSSLKMKDIFTKIKLFLTLDALLDGMNE